MATLLTVEQYATLTQLPPDKIRRRVRAGHLNALKKGRKWFIPSTEVRPESLNRYNALSWAIALANEESADDAPTESELVRHHKRPRRPIRFMRFVVTQLIGDANVPQGLFTAAYDLLHDGILTPSEHGELKELIKWFEDNLPAPDKSRFHEGPIFWYRTAALECISRMWELSNLLQSHGYGVEIFKAARLGRPVHSDNYQVAVYPSRSYGR